MNELFTVIRESLPQAIAALMSAAVLGAVGIAVRVRTRKDKKSDSSEHDNPIANVEPVPVDIVRQAEDFMTSFAAGVIKMVRPYQAIDPIELDELYSIWREDYGDTISETEFYALLKRLMQHRRIPGIVLRGREIFIEEEHFSWKTTHATEDKALIAAEAIKHIRSGQVIALDAGSTTLLIASEVAEALRTNMLRDITVVTNFFKVADELLKAALDMGLTDNDSILRIYMVGGRVRLNTLAVVDDDDAIAKDAFNNFHDVLASLGGADLAFVGTNGILRDIGFTTAETAEVLSKQSILSHAKRKFIVADPSKFGLQQERVFATFDMGIEIITTKHGDRRILREYERFLSTTSTRIVYAS